MLLISVTRRSIIFVFSFGIDFTIVVNVSTNVGFRPPEEHTMMRILLQPKHYCMAVQPLNNSSPILRMYLAIALPTACKHKSRVIFCTTANLWENTTCAKFSRHFNASNTQSSLRTKCKKSISKTKSRRRQLVLSLPLHQPLTNNSHDVIQNLR